MMKRILSRAILISLMAILLSMVSTIAYAAYSTYDGSIVNYQEFRDGTDNTTGYDADGRYGIQCWDGVQVFYQRLGMSLSTGYVLDANGEREGYAKHCWDDVNAREANTGTQFTQITRIEDVKRGDVLVFSGPSYTGHIGFADEDNDPSKSTITVWGQNQDAANSRYYFTAAEFDKSYFLGAFRYKVWAKYIVTLDPNGGSGEAVAFEKDYDESFVLSESTVSFSKKDYYLDHWSTAPDDSGTTYRFGNNLKGVNATLYAIWNEAIPPEITGDVYASNITYNSFTIKAPVDDNVGVTYVGVQVAPYLVPSNRKTVQGTYDNATKQATITVSLDKLKFRTDLYYVKLIARDAAGNTLNYALDPLSTYIIDTTDKGIWKAIDSDTPVYATPAASGTYNGVSQIKRYVKAGEKFDMLGSMEADGIEWLRIGATSEFVKKSDFKYDTFSNLWKNIVAQFVFSLRGSRCMRQRVPRDRLSLTGRHPHPSEDQHMEARQPIRELKEQTRKKQALRSMKQTFLIQNLDHMYRQISILTTMAH